MKNIHNVLSDLKDEFDPNNTLMDIEVVDLHSPYIQIYIDFRQGGGYMCVEVREEGPDEYGQVALVEQRNVSNGRANHIMNTLMSLWESD